MNINDYVFNIGDEVITANGEKGKIVDICKCEHCEERGFYEPTWEDEDGDLLWITDYEAAHGFWNFYKIGEYTFGNLNKSRVADSIKMYERSLEQLRGRLAVIEELEKELKNESLESV